MYKYSYHLPAKPSEKPGKLFPRGPAYNGSVRCQVLQLQDNQDKLARPAEQKPKIKC